MYCSRTRDCSPDRSLAWLFGSPEAAGWKSLCPCLGNQHPVWPDSGELAQSIPLVPFPGAGKLRGLPAITHVTEDPQGAPAPLIPWAPRVCSAPLDSPAWPLLTCLRGDQALQLWPVVSLGNSAGTVRCTVNVCPPSRASVPPIALRVQLMQPGP